MKRILAMAFILYGCVSPVANRQWWVPMDTTQRVAKNVDSVIALDGEPTRPYIVIGRVDAQGEQFHSRGQRINSPRVVAARHGADAVILNTDGSVTAIVWK